MGGNDELLVRLIINVYNKYGGMYQWKQRMQF
jgi:hypothetical protein